MNDLNISNLIIQLVTFVVTMIPLCVIIYNQGCKDQRLTVAEKNINEIGGKIDRYRDHYTETLTELKAQIDNISRTLIHVTTSMDFILKSIEELKKK